MSDDFGVLNYTRDRRSVFKMLYQHKHCQSALKKNRDRMRQRRTILRGKPQMQKRQLSKGLLSSRGRAEGVRPPQWDQRTGHWPWRTVLKS